ncbi:MAG: hypothetical protein OJF49_002493 [Ktedonobacterales bacterium]|jgi:hypothetical protein|nr:MAG: hypothetical protein OJF49_002493 [Ktedonobacterales bacterium]
MDEFEIRADYDEKTIAVYQAYRREIALAAIQHNRFVPPFSLNRMTWIKPSFLWMMERCGWTRKPGQEYVLAVRITRAGWEEALGSAVLTAPNPTLYGDHDGWRRQLEAAPVRVQWDPERTITGASLPQRSIQVGLGRQIIERYVNEWTVEIRDMTPLVHRLYALRHEGHTERVRALLPREHVYPLDTALRRRLGMGSAGGKR